MYSTQQYRDLEIKCDKKEYEIEKMLSLMEERNTKLRHMARRINMLEKENNSLKKMILSSTNLDHLKYMKSIVIAHSR